MLQHLTAKLKHFADLDLRATTAFERNLDSFRLHQSRRDIVAEGATSDSLLVLLSGWACRYSVLKNGSRQITTFLLPGDIVHLNAFARAPVADAIGAISPVETARLAWTNVVRLTGEHPVLREAMLSAQIADEALLRSAIVTVGRRDASERVGYQLCELWCRAAIAGLIDGDQLLLPITQADLADCLGLTAVHVNRVLRRFRDEGLIDWKPRNLLIPDFDKLARRVGFEQERPSSPNNRAADRPHHRFRYTSSQAIAFR